MLPKISRLLRIYGQVHGVGYRQSMLHEATRLGLVGWVRNRKDGTVEALICGNAEAIEAILVWAEKGPPLASVEKITVTESLPSFYREFSVTSTE